MDTNKSSSSSHTKILVEIIVFASLAAVLYTLRPFTLPFGGSITLGSMVPVMWLALRRGAKVGITSGAVFGMLALMIDVVSLGASSVIATPVQVLFEYPIAFGVIGLTGLLRGRGTGLAVLGAGVSVLIRFLIHYLVGVFVWSTVYQFPSEWGLWLWPAVYNGSFLSVEFVISAILLFALIKKRTLEYRL